MEVFNFCHHFYFIQCPVACRQRQGYTDSYRWKNLWMLTSDCRGPHEEIDSVNSYFLPFVNRLSHSCVWYLVPFQDRPWLLKQILVILLNFSQTFSKIKPGVLVSCLVLSKVKIAFKKSLPLFQTPHQASSSCRLARKLTFVHLSLKHREVAIIIGWFSQHKKLKKLTSLWPK